MAECKYKGCREQAFEEGYCILHLYPSVNVKTDINKIQKLKFRKFQEKIANKDFNFEGIVIQDVDLSGMKIKADVNFRGAKLEDVKLRSTDISGKLDFTGAEILQWLDISNAEIGTNAIFKSVKFPNKSIFKNIKVNYDLTFNKSKFNGYLVLDNANVGWRIILKNVFIGDSISFSSARARFLNLDKSSIGSNIHLKFKELEEGLSFQETTFIKAETQEYACRYAKNVWEGFGDREKADYYFYREMEAKRLQKRFYIRYSEWFIQKFFGYGVHPLRVVLTWLSVVFIFSIIYWYGNCILDAHSFKDYVYFSIVTAATPGYAGYRPIGNYQLFASFEAIFGTFMWAVVIATFARKYMR